MATIITVYNAEQLSYGRENDKVVSLLVAREGQLLAAGGGESTRYLIVASNDTASGIQSTLGFSLLKNLVDGVRFGDPGFEPSWEWIMHHDGWFELAFVVSDDGSGWIVFVQDDDRVDPDILSLCRAYAP